MSRYFCKIWGACAVTRERRAQRAGARRPGLGTGGAFAPEVPCHRVVAADGSLHGFGGRTDAEALARKRQLLVAEGARF